MGPFARARPFFRAPNAIPTAKGGSRYARSTDPPSNRFPRSIASARANSFIRADGAKDRLQELLIVARGGRRLRRDGEPRSLGTEGLAARADLFVVARRADVH